MKKYLFFLLSCMLTLSCTSGNKEKEPIVDDNNSIALCLRDSDLTYTDTLGIIENRNPEQGETIRHTIQWSSLIDNNEGVIKVYFNEYINQLCREKTEEVQITQTAHNNDRVCIYLISHKFLLNYLRDATFYREDSEGKLHKIVNNEDHNSVSLVFEKETVTEICIDFPQNCRTGDYLLKLNVYGEHGERYEIRQWFEAYTEKQISRRDKPIWVGPQKAPIAEEENEDGVYEVVTMMPEFPGGMPALMKFIDENLQYPVVNGRRDEVKRVIIQVIIDTDGNVTKPVVLRGISPAFDKEALRVTKLLPQWKPGRNLGRAVKVRYTFPVTFKLKKDCH